MLLVHAFILDMEEEMSLTRAEYSNIIPITVRDIIYQYSKTPIRIFIKNTTDIHSIDVTSSYNPSISFNRINLKDINKNPKYDLSIPLNSYYRAQNKFDTSYCYIPYISQLLPTYKNNIDGVHGTYDGIFTTRKLCNSSASPYFLLFQPNTCYDHIFESSIPISTKISDFIYCGDEYGIIGVHNDIYSTSLFQLKLSDIKNEHFQFNMLPDPDDGEIPIWTDSNEQKLSMLWLKSDDCLFAIGSKKFVANNGYYRECGIYDFTDNTWMKISALMSKGEMGGDFECGLINTYNDRYKTYLVSNLGNTAQYDFVKDLWINLYSDCIPHNMCFPKAPTVWINDDEPNILYCIAHNDKYCRFLSCRYFDVRVYRRKWINCMNNVELQFKNNLSPDISLFM